MFCNYCGMMIPDDALFCNKCGRRQQAASSTSGTDITILPVPPFPEVSMASEQPLVDNVPMVQGTSSTTDSFPAGQSISSTATNAAPSATSVSPHAGRTLPGLSNSPSGQHIAPHFTPSGSSLTSQSESQAPQPQVPSSYTPYSAVPQPYAVQHPSFPLEQQPQSASPTQMPIQNQHIEQSTPFSHQSHLETTQIVPKAAKVAGSLSRRAVLAGLLGGTGIVAVGGGIALFAYLRSQQISLSSSPHSSSVNSLQTSTPSLAQLTVYIASNDGYTYALNASNGSLLWKSQVVGSLGGTFANGVLYTDAVAAMRTSDRQLLWSYQTAGQISIGSVPAVSDGYVYTSGGGDKLVHAFRASDGSSIWSYQVNNGPFSSPAVGNGVVYVGTDRVYALRASDGSLLWWYQTGGSVESAPTLENGVVYVSSEDRSVYALRMSDGTLLWSYQTGVDSSGFGGIGGSPRVSNGRAFFTADDGYVYALRASDGTLLWRYQMGGSSNDSVALYQGVVYSPSYDHHIYALRASDGTLLWSYQTGDRVNSSPIVVDGVLYVGSLDHYVYALRASDGTLLWRYQTGGWIQSAPTIGV